MQDRISESELIIPALKIINQNGGCIDTTDLIKKLRDILQPSGEDLKILSGRNDDKFSQKVRNLVSHRSIESDGYMKYNEDVGICITDKGRKYIDSL